MSKTAYVRARIEPFIKKQVEKILYDLGITPAIAINILYKQIIRSHGLPLDLKIPNEETQTAIDEAIARKDVVVCKDLDDLFDKLGIAEDNGKRK